MAKKNNGKKAAVKAKDGTATQRKKKATATSTKPSTKPSTRQATAASAATSSATSGKKVSRKKVAGVKAAAGETSAARKPSSKANAATAASGRKPRNTATAGQLTQSAPAKTPAPPPTTITITPLPPPPLEPLVEPETISEARLRRVAKEELSKAEVEQYRCLLVQKRNDLLGDVEALENDARNDSGDHFSPEHMADIGSNNYEQEFTMGLVESEQKLLREIDEALLRIENRTYGVCAQTAKPIGKVRLDAKPWAKYCIEVAREKERLGLI